MLNKDQYNQEEYEEYYRQETGAIDEDIQDEKSGLINKIIILLILLALSIAGYFGYKAMNNSDLNNADNTSKELSPQSSLPQSVQKESTEEVAKTDEANESVKKAQKSDEASNKEENKTTETKKQESVQELQTKSTVTSEVNKAVSTQGKMSPEEIAAVVAAVMKQMNQDKSTNTQTNSVTSKKDTLLINELSDSEVDSVSADLMKELKSVDISENTKIDNSKKQIDVYNKVNVQNVSGEDTLSQLSKQITSVIAEGVKKDEAATYTKSLKSEVSVRTNEMRIIVVKKGDTLGKIAKRAYGNVMDYKKIYQANPEVTRPDRIYIGQKLRIPN